VKLGAKFAVSLVIPLVTLTVLIGYFYQQQSNAMLREELSKEGRAIAFVVEIAAEDYLRDRQLNDLRLLIDRTTGYERVLGLRLFDARGGLIYQSTSLDSFPFQSTAALTSVLEKHRYAETRRLFGTQPTMGFIFPLIDPKHELIGAVQVLQLESYMQEDDSATRRFILMLSAAMVLATIFIVLIVTRFSVTKPITYLVNSFRQVGARAHPDRVPVSGEDELAMLAREFNSMCERLETARRSLQSEQEQRRDVEDRLRSAERLAGLGRLAAGLAHEIGTPLNVISGRAEALQRSVAGQQPADRHVRIIATQIDRIARTVRDMLDFARMKAPQRVETDVVQVLGSVLELIEGPLAARNVRVVLAKDGDLPRLVADPNQLQQVFLNVVTNAMDAMTSGGELGIRVATRVAPHPEDGGPSRRWIAVRFEDTGTGIPLEDRAHVFDPFFTTKDVGRGTGLGLSVSYGIVREHGGWFDLDSETGHGTRLTVFLPIEDSQASAAADERRAS